MTRTLATESFVLITLGGRGTEDKGLGVDRRGEQLYDAIAELPVDSVIAGWPQTAIESVPYLSRRGALLTFETHQAFHRKYAEEMRRRMRALIDVMFATSYAPLIRLREDFGATHLLVHLPHLRGGRLSYFKPFDRWIAAARARRAAGSLVLQELVDDASVYRDHRYALVDLRELDAAE